MTLSINELPLSFAYQAARWGAYNSYLNPPNSTLSHYKVIKYTGKFIRGVARLVYQISAALLCCPLGILYHTTAAIACKGRSWFVRNPITKAKSAELAWEHLSCAFYDGWGMARVLGQFFESPESTAASFAPSTAFVKIDPSATINNGNAIPIQGGAGWHRYGVGIQRRVSYKRLARIVAKSWKEHAQRRQVDDPAVIKLAVEGSAGNRAVPAVAVWPMETPSGYEKIDIRQVLTPGQLIEAPSYSISKKEIAWKIATAVLLLVIIAAVGCLLALTSIGGALVLIDYVFEITTLLLGMTYLNFLAARKAKRLHITHRGEAERSLARTVLSRGESDCGVVAGAWFLKACYRADPVAQHVYGQSLLKKAEQALHTLPRDLSGEERAYRFKGISECALEGLTWLDAAAQNGNQEAVQDLNKLFTQDEIILFPDSLSAVQYYLRMGSFQENVRGLIKSRELAGLDPKLEHFMLEVQSHSDMKKRQKVTEAIYNCTPLIKDLAKIVTDYAEHRR